MNPTTLLSLSVSLFRAHPALWKCATTIRSAEPFVVHPAEVRVSNGGSLPWPIAGMLDTAITRLATIVPRHSKARARRSFLYRSIEPRRDCSGEVIPFERRTPLQLVNEQTKWWFVIANETGKINFSSFENGRSVNSAWEGVRLRFAIMEWNLFTIDLEIVDVRII